MNCDVSKLDALKFIIRAIITGSSIFNKCLGEISLLLQLENSSFPIFIRKLSLRNHKAKFPDIPHCSIKCLYSERA